jgi:ABC-type uncharacterized transport system substrate-binding protein
MLRLLSFGLVLILSAITGPGSFASDLPSAPQDNDGERWRVSYYQGGDYKDYYDYLVAVIQGLMTLGWIEPATIPQNADQRTTSLWRWLSTQAQSRYLEFSADAFYDATWNEDRRGTVRATLLDRLSGHPEFDLVIAMGTWAGQDLANSTHTVPTTVVSASAEDSGLDHLHTQIDPLRYARQLRLFHDAIGFRRLGVAFEDTLTGRSYAAMDFVEQVAEERDFEIVRCHAVGDIADTAQAEQNLMKCFDRLVSATDAIYVTSHGGITDATLSQIASMARDHRVPTFSQHGADEAEDGLMLSMSIDSFRHIGLFHARCIAQIFNGAKPRSLPMVFEEEPKLAINLFTARAVGYIPPFHLLAGADLLFRDSQAEY